MSDRNRRGRLSAPLRWLLAELHFRRTVSLHATKWVSQETGKSFQHKTIEAAYDRNLVSIIYDSRHKKRQLVELTEIGELVASSVVERSLKAAPPVGVSEAAALLIQEIISQ